MPAEIAVPDGRAATDRALRQLRTDHANAVEVDDICTEVNTFALGVALAEITRLNERLNEFVGWEPTVREEYQHACDQLSRVESIVKFFDADRRAGDPAAADTGSFVASLKHALEMT